MGKTLITGVSGFVGRNLLDYLKTKEPDAFGSIACLSSKRHDFLDTILYTKDGSIYHFELPDDIETIIHIGAWTPESSSVANNIDKSNSNIAFTSCLLEKLSISVRHFVFISTIDVYGDTQAVIDEQLKPDPVTLYGASKWYCERMVQAWADKRGIAYQVLRLGHIYGRREDRYKKLIPVLIHKLLDGETLTLFSDGQEKRSFLHVSDCVRCIWEASKKEHSCGVVNIVSGIPWTVADITHKLVVISGQDAEIEILSEDVTTRDYVFNDAKMRFLFGGESVSLDEGLKDEYIYFRDKQL